MRCRIRTTGGSAGQVVEPPGFTLIELLVVMAIISILLVVVSPMVTGVNRGRNVASGAYGVHDLLQYARSEAMARNTYTWVGFANLPTTSPSNKSGGYQMVAAAFCSQDGTANAGKSLISSLVKPARFTNIKLTSLAGINADVKGQMDSSTELSVASQTSPKSLPVIVGVTFQYTVTFTPQGLAMLKAEPTLKDGFDEALDLGLIPMTGDREMSGPNDVCIRVSGASGNSHIYRLR